MTIFKSPGPELAPPPDNLTLPQFILDTEHPLRQLRTGPNLNQKPWLIDDVSGKTYSFEEIRSRTFGLANAMAKRWNIGDGDVVCIYSPNHIDYPNLIWAIHRLGAVASCANPSYTEPELQHQIEAVKAALLFVHPVSYSVGLAAARAAGLSADRVVAMEPVPAPARSSLVLPTLEQLVQEGLRLPHPPAFVEKRLGPGESQRKIAFLSFSSGTTGKPKAVAIPHYSVISNILQFATFNQNNDPGIPLEQARFRPGDVATAVLPFYHIYGLVVNLHASLFCGLSLVVFSKFSWIDFLRSIEKYRVTHLFIVPPHVVLFVKHPETRKHDLSRLRYCMMGAAPVSLELTQQFRQLLPKCFVGQGYGMTETATVLTMPPISQRDGGTPGSAGQLVSGTEAKVVKVDGSLATYGEAGELYVRGPQGQFNRYLNNSQANAETFVDGWIRTGDGVVFEKNQDMFIIDRLKELIKCRGYQVAPAELEGHLLDHPDVSDVGVVGVQDDFAGEIPMAFVALSHEAKERLKNNPNDADVIKTSICKHVSDAKVRYKWLDGGVEFIEVVPKNPSGKLLRRFLRDKAKEIMSSRKKDVKARL